MNIDLLVEYPDGRKGMISKECVSQDFIKANQAGCNTGAYTVVEACVTEG